MKTLVRDGDAGFKRFGAGRRSRRWRRVGALGVKVVEQWEAQGRVHRWWDRRQRVKAAAKRRTWPPTDGGGKSLPSPFVLDNNHWLTPGPAITLKGQSFKSFWTEASENICKNQVLGIKDGVGGVHGNLVLGVIDNKPLGVGEGDVERGDRAPLVVGDDLHPIMLPHTDARVGHPEIDPIARPSPFVTASTEIEKS